MPNGERIAVIGAGPAGLTYASLVADRNEVTVFERARRAGGAFRYAGKAPLFQEVVAEEGSFDRYIGQLVAACAAKGVTFQYGTDVTHAPELLTSFERLVIATGARYRFGLGAVVKSALEAGLARRSGIRRLLARPEIRDWFYYRARVATGATLRCLAAPGQKVDVIGDAVSAGKSMPAIASAFEAAFSSL
jgi:hypothetical protein